MTTTDRPGAPSPDDASWAALRYVLDEMSSGERDAFEQELGRDQQVREQLADAVRLLSDLHAGSGDRATNGRIVPTRATSPTRKPRRWFRSAIAASVCLAITTAVGLLVMYSHRDREERVPTDPSDNGVGRLVAIWSERLVESAPEAGFDATDSEHGEVLAANDQPAAREVPSPSADSDAVAETSRGDELHLPDWLLAAVSLGPS